MDDPQSPAPQPFKLPPFVWIVAVITAAITAFLQLGNLRGGAYGVGQVIGYIVGLGIFPTLISWIVWRLSGRSQRSAVIAFFITLALLAAGQISQVSERGKQQVALEQFTQNIETKKAELKAQVEEGEDVTQEQLENLTNQSQDNLSELAATSKGQDREMALAMQTFIARGQTLQKRHGESIAALQLETFLDLNGHENAELRTLKLAGIAEWKSSNAALRDYVANATVSIQEELESRGVSWVNIRDVLKGYRASSSRINASILAIRDLDHELAETLTEFIAFAAEYEGQWSFNPDTGELLLPSAEALETYTKLTTRVSEISQEQIALQRKIFTNQ